jgi:hypothetical protein
MLNCISSQLSYWGPYLRLRYRICLSAVIVSTRCLSKTAWCIILWLCYLNYPVRYFWLINRRVEYIPIRRNLTSHSYSSKLIDAFLLPCYRLFMGHNKSHWNKLPEVHKKIIANWPKCDAKIFWYKLVESMSYLLSAPLCENPTCSFRRIRLPI